MKKIFMLAAVMCIWGVSVTEAACGGCGHGSGCGYDIKGGSLKAGSEKMLDGRGCPLMINGADIKVKQTRKGAVITITADDSGTVKRIHEAAATVPKNHRKCMMHMEEKKSMEKTDVKGAEEGYAVCPVMGRKVKKAEAKWTSEYKGKKYYFCCASCKPKFDKNPGKYLK